MSVRLLLGGVLVMLLIVLWLTTRSARAQDEAEQAWSGWTVADTFDALDGVSASTGVSWQRLYLIVRCETGNTFWPYSVGRAGERGVVQLHPRGELPRFHAWGYRDPYNPYEAIEFLAIRLQQGGARAWSCA